MRRAIGSIERVRRAGLLLAFALLAFAVGTPAQAVDPTEMPTPVLQTRYIELTRELRCMQCQNQSIYDSPVGLAGDLRREVRDMLLDGRSDQEIRDFMKERYGPFILMRPEISLHNAWLWLAPALLLLIGVVIAVRIVRQRAALAPLDQSGIEEEDTRR